MNEESYGYGARRHWPHDHDHDHEHAGRRRFGPPGDAPPRRRRRGDIRTAVLAVLLEAPGHGYQVIQTLEERSGGSWKPSAGSVYPTLQLLEDEGMVRSSEQDGRKVYELTDAGRAEAERRVEEAGAPPWERRGGSERRELFDAVKGLALAAKQVAVSGTPEQVTRGAGILREARKQLFAMLAEG
jgi:DNA-binding PadR family transcriptional regulator